MLAKGFGCCLALSAGAEAALSASRPNIIYMLSDDMGYGDNSYSRPHSGLAVETPNLERLAREGLVFLTGYSGPICAPSRTTLMTGRHMGHTTIRGNDGSYSPLLTTDVTVAAVLKSAGYHTALMGKWGLGDAGSSGYPLAQGFDEFIGQDSQVGCHNWYPAVIQNNTDSQHKIGANAHATKQSCGDNLEKCVWANDIFVNESISFLRRRSKEEKPFFLYFSTTTPHEGFLLGDDSKNPVPWPYNSKFSNESSWTTRNRDFARAVWAQDVLVGRLLDELDALDISKNTIVFFSGDNGPSQGRDFAFDDAAGPFRGFKSTLHEGGIRQQVLARWPGRIKAGSKTDHWFAFWDFLPTAVDLANATLPSHIDGISAVPSLEGQVQENLTPIYYEFCWNENYSQTAYEAGWVQAYRQKDFKAIRVNGENRNMLLYDLSTDIGETKNIAAMHPELVKQLGQYMDASHTDSSAWPKGTKKKKCCMNCYNKGGCGGACSGHHEVFTV